MLLKVALLFQSALGNSEASIRRYHDDDDDEECDDHYDRHLQASQTLNTWAKFTSFGGKGAISRISGRQQLEEIRR